MLFKRALNKIKMTINRKQELITIFCDVFLLINLKL